MKVSAIMAAYNAEKYLRPAMDSITSQTLDDYEIIVINDGSTDQTQAILEEYQSRCPNMTVRYQTNQGPSAARNYGISLAKGEYLYFFDADDIVEQTALASLYERASLLDADLVIAKYDILNGDSLVPVNTLNELTVLDSIGRYDHRLLLTFTLWNKLYRKSVVTKHRLTFPPVSYSEDGVFTLNMIFHAKVIAGLNQIVLHYRRNYAPDTTSITAKVSVGKLQDFLAAHEMMRESAAASILRDYPAFTSLKEVMEQNAAIRDFMNFFSYKEIHTLLTQFYVHFWQTDEECRSLIIRSILEKYHTAPFIVKEDLLEKHCLLPLSRQKLTKEDLLEHAMITVALYQRSGQQESFLRTLASLTGSNYVACLFAMPKTHRSLLESLGLLQDNFIFIEEKYCSDYHEFYKKVIETAHTRYLLLCDDSFLYHYQMIGALLKKMESGLLDYCIEPVSCFDNKQRALFSGHKLMYAAQAGGRGNFDYMIFDRLWANKMFRTSFLRDQIRDGLELYSLAKKLPQRGRHAFLNHNYILFDGTNADFLSYLKETSGPDFSAETANSLLRPPVPKKQIIKDEAPPSSALHKIKRLFQKVKGNES